jgi:hypothetical protein
MFSDGAGRERAKALRLPPGLWASPHGPWLTRYRRGGFGALNTKPLLGRSPKWNGPRKWFYGTVPMLRRRGVVEE